jgi:cell division protein FtsZ
VLRQGVQGISELVTRPGLINLDFADVRSVMRGAGGALITIGHGEGENKAQEAAKVALGSPLLDIESVQGTNGLLVNLTGGEDLTLAEIDSAMRMISEAAMPHAEILFGTVIDPKMENRVQITLIATGVGVDEPAPIQPATTGTRVPFDATMMFGEDESLEVPAFMRRPARARAGVRSLP